MLTRYLLFFVLLLVFWRFLDKLAGLGRRVAGKGPSWRVPRGRGRPAPLDRDISDADYEILPEDDEGQSPPGS